MQLSGPRFGMYTPQQIQELSTIIQPAFLEGTLLNHFKPLNADEISIYQTKRSEDESYFYELLRNPGSIQEDNLDHSSKLALDEATRNLGHALDRIEQFHLASTITQIVNFLGNMPNYSPSEQTFGSIKRALSTMKEKLKL